MKSYAQYCPEFIYDNIEHRYKIIYKYDYES